MRNTQQRQVVLEELRKLHTHPTAAEVYEYARRRLPRISLGTVYRNLEHLAQEGMISKLGAGPTEARFDGSTDPHHHVRCTRCGRLGDVHGLPEGLSCFGPVSVEGYEVVGYHLELLGVCSQCSKPPAPATPTGS